MTLLPTSSLTPASLDLFRVMAVDAGNWNDMPLIGGNFEITKEERGNLTQLKKSGLVVTQKDEGDLWVLFTTEGSAFALAQFGISVQGLAGGAK